MPVSIREVAAHAGASVGTVSNVLNRPDIVARPTRERVHAAIKALGFVRNESARQLRAGRSRTIGLVVLDVANPFFTASAAVPLSSVRQPRQQLGRTAAQLLLEESVGGDGHRRRQVIFQPELEVRRSSQAPSPATAPPQTAPPQTAPPQTAPPQTAPPQTAPAAR